MVRLEIPQGIKHLKSFKTYKTQLPKHLNKTNYYINAYLVKTNNKSSLWNKFDFDFLFLFLLKKKLDNK